jgi:hypothetical protein
MDNIKDTIMSSIKANRVPMRSRLHFFLRGMLWVGGIIVTTAVALFLVSFTIFVLRGNGLFEVPHFGMRGLIPLLFSLPWLIVLGIVFLVGVLEVLGTQFAFVYRRPLVYSILGITLATVLGGALIAQSTLHERMFAANQEHRVPGFGPLYDRALRDRTDVHVGTITALTPYYIEIETRNGTTTRIATTSETRMPPTPFTLGDVVVVMGEEKDATITALGIRPLDKQRALFPRKDRRTLPPPPPEAFLQ